MPGDKNKIRLPDIAVHLWVRRTDADSFAVSHCQESEWPRVLLRKNKGGFESDVFNVDFVRRDDGVHALFQSQKGPTLHIVLKNRNMRRITSGLLALIASEAMEREASDSGISGHKWIRKMYEKLDKAAEVHGPTAFSGIPQSFVEATRMCGKSYDKAAGLDVDDARATMRKVFSILSEAMTEEEVVAVWREASGCGG